MILYVFTQMIGNRVKTLADAKLDLDVSLPTCFPILNQFPSHSGISSIHLNAHVIIIHAIPSYSMVCIVVVFHVLVVYLHIWCRWLRDWRRKLLEWFYQKMMGQYAWYCLLNATGMMRLPAAFQSVPIFSSTLPCHALPFFPFLYTWLFVLFCSCRCRTLAVKFMEAAVLAQTDTHIVSLWVGLLAHRNGSDAKFITVVMSRPLSEIRP